MAGRINRRGVYRHFHESPLGYIQQRKWHRKMIQGDAREVDAGEIERRIKTL